MIDFIEKFPEQPFVLDHMGKPEIENKKSWDWENYIKEIALHPNVYCKISGLVTEADLKNWKKTDFNFYIRYALEKFGIERVMFGSDWPVCLLGANYREVCDIVGENSLGLTENDRSKLWGENAALFYNIET